jgi:hypothetical protein
VFRGDGDLEHNIAIAEESFRGGGAQEMQDFANSDK